MPRHPARSRDPRMVGIIARTAPIAKSLARELNISYAVCFSPNSYSPLREHDLSVLLVDEDIWPLKRATLDEVAPSLKRHGAYVLMVNRFDPTRQVPCE